MMIESSNHPASAAVAMKLRTCKECRGKAATMVFPCYPMVVWQLMATMSWEIR